MATIFNRGKGLLDKIVAVPDLERITGLVPIIIENGWHRRRHITAGHLLENIVNLAVCTDGMLRTLSSKTSIPPVAVHERNSHSRPICEVPRVPERRFLTDRGRVPHPAPPRRYITVRDRVPHSTPPERAIVPYRSPVQRRSPIHQTGTFSEIRAATDRRESLLLQGRGSFVSPDSSMHAPYSVRLALLSGNGPPLMYGQNTEAFNRAITKNLTSQPPPNSLR